jgi:hypothetical protein
MTSQINPNNIDGAYPVAGQDNNSQGFRDNFTNIKVNFQYAEDEINDLDANVVLKAALTGQALDNNMNNNTIYAVNLNDVSTSRTLLTATSGSITINYATGQYQAINPSANISLAFSNFPASGFYGSVRLRINVTNTTYTVTLPAAVSVNAVGIQGYASNVITFAAIGVYEFDFGSSDGGTTITITEANKELQPFNASSEDLAASAGANLALTTSYFTTAAAETATLAAGVNGQIKVLAAANVSAGNMVVTVSNAGWKTSGTGNITFSGTYGAACTLQYTNSKWYCIGNNGATFA